MGKYINKAKPKEGIFTCVGIYFDMDLEGGMDYKQLPFTCKNYHEYGNIAKDYKKKLPQAQVILNKQQ